MFFNNKIDFGFGKILPFMMVNKIHLCFDVTKSYKVGVVQGACLLEGAGPVHPKAAPVRKLSRGLLVGLPGREYL